MKNKIKRIAYRLFRKMKKHYLSHPVRPDTYLFFWLVDFADKVLSPRKKISQTIWKKLYSIHYGQQPLFKLHSDELVALNSDDQKWPRGTILDNSSNYRFNLKIYDHFQHRHDLRILDLGCSGGAFVRSFLEDGFTAIGLEGSNASKKLRSAEWDTCWHHLFTCDITSPFSITRNDEILKFHCITLWEVLEHIPEEKLNSLFENIKNNLSDDGIFVGSIDTAPDGNPITGAVYHVTLRPKSWWLEKFDAAGLVPVLEHKFSTKDFVRGHGMGLKDWDPSDGEGFHVVLRKK